MGVLTDANFFDSKSWTGRGKGYRELAEPMDIANWYIKEKNVDCGHYADDILDELNDDNKKRPGRYQLLQRQEFRVFGSTKSSLTKAHLLKALLGTASWKSLKVYLGIYASLFWPIFDLNGRKY